MVVPEWRAVDTLTSMKALLVTGLPSASMVTPVMIPSAGASTPVVNSPSSTRIAAPTAILNT